MNDLILGVLSRAQRRYDVMLVSFNFLSNHFHLLLWVETAKQLADFMRYLNGNLARELARHHRWRGRVWSGRYHAALVSEEEYAQVARLRYILANGCKEGLVASPQEWPGVSSLPAVLKGQKLQGHWFNRTREWTARQRRGAVQPETFAEEETVELSPLPCWAHLSAESYLQRIQDLVADIEEETQQLHGEAGTAPAGPAAVRRADPLSAPRELKESFAPLVHSATKKVRREIWEAYAMFVAAFEAAAEQLRAGNLTAAFPEGSFPPPAPFVRPLLEPG